MKTIVKNTKSNINMDKFAKQNRLLSKVIEKSLTTELVQLVTFKTAILAKEKGFIVPTDYGWIWYKETPPNPKKLIESEWVSYNLPCKVDKIYNDYLKGATILNYSMGVCISRPTQSVLQKWLREKHKIHIEIKGDENDIEGLFAFKMYFIGKITSKPSTASSMMYKKYENALEDALKESLKWV